MKVNPLNDRVVIKRIGADKQTTSGIIIPDNAADKPDQGVVVAVGTGYKTEAGEIVPLTVSVDDKVIFGKNSGHPVKIDGEEFLVLKEEEIFAIIEE